MTEPLDLEAIEERLKKATQGPWFPAFEEGQDYPLWVARASDSLNIARCERPEDAAFIAHAPSDIEALVGEVRRLRGEVAELHRLDRFTQKLHEESLDAVRAHHRERAEKAEAERDRYKRALERIPQVCQPEDRAMLAISVARQALKENT